MDTARSILCVLMSPFYLTGWPPRSRIFTHQAPQGFFDYFYSIISTLLGMSPKATNATLLAGIHLQL